MFCRRRWLICSRRSLKHKIRKFYQYNRSNKGRSRMKEVQKWSQRGDNQDDEWKFPRQNLKGRAFQLVTPHVLCCMNREVLAVCDGWCVNARGSSKYFKRNLKIYDPSSGICSLPNGALETFQNKEVSKSDFCLWQITLKWVRDRLMGHETAEKDTIQGTSVMIQGEKVGHGMEQ